MQHLYQRKLLKRLMVDKAQKWPRAFASHLEKSNYFVTDFTALSVSSSIWPSLLKAGLGQFTKFDRGRWQ
jgi:hypothetical protein